MDGRAVAVRSRYASNVRRTNRTLGGKGKKKKRGTFCVSAWPKIKLCRHVSEKVCGVRVIGSLYCFFFIPDILGLKPPYFACLILGSTSVRSRNFAVGGDNV